MACLHFGLSLLFTGRTIDHTTKQCCWRPGRTITWNFAIVKVLEWRLGRRTCPCSWEDTFGIIVLHLEVQSLWARLILNSCVQAVVTCAILTQVHTSMRWKLFTRWYANENVDWNINQNPKPNPGHSTIQLDNLIGWDCTSLLLRYAGSPQHFKIVHHFQTNFYMFFSDNLHQRNNWRRVWPFWLCSPCSENTCCLIAWDTKQSISQSSSAKSRFFCLSEHRFSAGVLTCFLGLLFLASPVLFIFTVSVVLKAIIHYLSPCQN